MIRLLKIDKNLSRQVHSENDADELVDSKRKNLINLREKFIPNKSIGNEKIPKKLLFEIASLSQEKFKIEAKSKSESVVLPLQIANKQNQLSKVINLKTEKDIIMDTTDTTFLNTTNHQTAIKSETNRTKVVTSPSSSPLENYYVTLKCTIVNRRLALVPPIRIFIPYNYPEANPLVDLIQLDEFDDDVLPEYSIFYLSSQINYS